MKHGKQYKSSWARRQTHEIAEVGADLIQGARKAGFVPAHKRHKR